MGSFERILLSVWLEVVFSFIQLSPTYSVVFYYVNAEIRISEVKIFYILVRKSKSKIKLYN